MIGFKKGRNNSFCKLNLRMDGSNDGTTFVDSSSGSKSVTRSGALTKTAVKKFGTASGYFDGTGDYLQIANSGDFDFGNRKFTIEFWIKRESVTNRNEAPLVFASTSSTANTEWVAQIGADNNLIFYIVATNNTYKATNAIAINDTDWHHIAIIRNGNSFYSSKDGILTSSVDVTGFTLKDINVSLYVGTYGTSGQDYTGYIDSLMISKGVAKYTRKFKVPNRAA